MLKLDLLTPGGVVVKNLECTDVKVPTYNGVIDVLEHHTQYLTQLGPGILEAKTAEGVRHFAVTHGICKVVGDKVSVLSITAETPETVDLDRAKKAEQKSKDKLAAVNQLDSIEMLKYQRKLERAKVRMTLGYLRGQ
jgi:F-type H+-transporting ATPase subunit epsilon